MSVFLGVDGGGTKTDFLLVDDTGSVLATYRGGSAYYFEVGIDGLRQMLATGIGATVSAASLSPSDITYSFLGLPAYGENDGMLPLLDGIVEETLSPGRYSCANDVVCGWAGALSGGDGIAVVAGTGSIAYGEWGSSSARAGGWGELFGDEGSAFWLAREALNLFSRMSDGRSPRGALYDLVRSHFHVSSDLELCAAVYGPPPLTRSEVAALSRLAGQAASVGDRAAMQLLERAAEELASLVHAVRDALHAPLDRRVPASYCGGLLQPGGALSAVFERALHASERQYQLAAPRLRPSAGAALRAATLSGAALTTEAVARLVLTHACHAAENAS